MPQIDAVVLCEWAPIHPENGIMLAGFTRGYETKRLPFTVPRLNVVAFASGVETATELPVEVSYTHPDGRMEWIASASIPCKPTDVFDLSICVSALDGLVLEYAGEYSIVVSFPAVSQAARTPLLLVLNRGLDRGRPEQE